MGQSSSISELVPELTLSPEHNKYNILASFESEGYTYVYNFVDLNQCVEWIEYYAEEISLCNNRILIDKLDVIQFFSSKIAKKVYNELLKIKKFSFDDKYSSNDLVFKDDDTFSSDSSPQLYDSSPQLSDNEFAIDDEEEDDKNDKKRKSTTSYNLRSKKAKY